MRKLIWTVSGKFSQVHKGDKIGLEKPISKASRSQFCLPREPEKTFHEHFISVWAHPKGKILRTDCFISFFWVFVCNSSKIKIYFATIMNQVMNAPSFQEFPWNSRPEACYFPITRIEFKLHIPRKAHSNRENTWKMKKMTVFLTIGIFLTAMRENGAGN